MIIYFLILYKFYTVIDEQFNYKVMFMPATKFRLRG